MPTIEYRCSNCRRPIVRNLTPEQADTAAQHAAQGRPFICRGCDGHGAVRMRSLEGGPTTTRGSMILDDDER